MPRAHVFATLKSRVGQLEKALHSQKKQDEQIGTAFLTGISLGIGLSYLSYFGLMFSK